MDDWTKQKNKRIHNRRGHKKYVTMAALALSIMLIAPATKVEAASQQYAQASLWELEKIPQAVDSQNSLFAPLLFYMGIAGCGIGVLIRKK